MKPRSEAIAFMIWAYANPLDWDCTVQEIAAHLDQSTKRVAAICRWKGWTSRLRSSGPFHLDKVIHTEEGWSSEDRLIGEEELVD